MAVSMETQRLISVSLGKIAQSRGQRGGINLHKNLLVATVLHKARTAYMIESYSYQQNLQRQKLLEQYQQQQQTLPTSVVEASPVGEPNKGEVCPSSRDSNLGQPPATPTGGEQSRADVSSETKSSAYEPMSVQDSNVVHDKENSPPSADDRHVIPDTIPVVMTNTPVPSDSHLSVSNQLSHEAQMASSDHSSWKQHNLTSGSTTCRVLKRRRDNPSTSLQDSECSVNKIAKVADTTISYPDYSTDSSEESSGESPHTPDSPQISSLVNIFNSGFSGLCLPSSSELRASSCHSDFDMSSFQSHTRKIATKAG